MRSILCFFTLTFLPFSMQAIEKGRNIFNQPSPNQEKKEINLHFDQLTLTRLSDYHYGEAISELNKTIGISWYIPDLGKRRHLEALLLGALSSAGAKTVPQKLLYTGLVLIGDLIVTAMHNYEELQFHLVKAQYHFEAADFYNMVSINRPKHKNTDEGTRVFLDGMDYLTYAIVLLEGIHPSFDCMLKDNSIVYALMSYRSDFLENQRNIGKRGTLLYENIYEIMVPCVHDVKHQIGENIGIMASKFKEAENIWKQKKKR